MSQKVRHVVMALQMMDSLGSKFIDIENADDVRGICPIVKFTIQSDPVSEVGVNGCQAEDMLIYVKCLFESLNASFPCLDNEATISRLEEAIFAQAARRRDRIHRGVEGKNEV